MGKIQFENQSTDTLKKQGEELDFSDVHEGMEVFFENDQNQIALGEITEVFKEGYFTDESEMVTGCVVSSSDNAFFRYREDGHKLWKVFVEQKEIKQEEAPKKQEKNLPNIFTGKSELEITYSKFPSWDILPPDQFINPRIKS